MPWQDRSAATQPVRHSKRLLRLQQRHLLNLGCRLHHLIVVIALRHCYMCPPAAAAACSSADCFRLAGCLQDPGPICRSQAALYYSILTHGKFKTNLPTPLLGQPLDAVVFISWLFYCVSKVDQPYGSGHCCCFAE